MEAKLKRANCNDEENVAKVGCSVVYERSMERLSSLSHLVSFPAHRFDWRRLPQAVLCKWHRVSSAFQCTLQGVEDGSFEC